MVYLILFSCDQFFTNIDQFSYSISIKKFLFYDINILYDIKASNY